MIPNPPALSQVGGALVYIDWCKVQCFAHFIQVDLPGNLLPLCIGIIIALKQKRAAISAEYSDVLSKLKDLKKTS